MLPSSMHRDIWRPAWVQWSAWHLGHEVVERGARISSSHHLRVRKVVVSRRGSHPSIACRALSEWQQVWEQDASHHLARIEIAKHVAARFKLGHSPDLPPNYPPPPKKKQTLIP